MNKGMLDRCKFSLGSLAMEVFAMGFICMLDGVIGVLTCLPRRWFVCSASGMVHGRRSTPMSTPCAASMGTGLGTHCRQRPLGEMVRGGVLLWRSG